MTPIRLVDPRVVHPRLVGSAVVLALVFASGAATATEELPVIVTYEMQKLHEAERIERRDPAGFWVRQIVARLEDRKPDGTIGLKKPVTVHVSFVVGREGQVVSKSVREPSGEPAADAAALAMLDRAAPFPPMPATLTGADVAFTVPLRFR